MFLVILYLSEVVLSFELFVCYIKAFTGKAHYRIPFMLCSCNNIWLNPNLFFFRRKEDLAEMVQGAVLQTDPYALV
jgi:hypothetical protein